MATSFKYVQGDTGPQIKLTLTESDTGSPINLTSGTVTLHFRAAGEETVLFSRQLFIDQNTASNGEAILQWQTNDLAQEVGSYEGQVEVVLSTGLRETLFDLLKFKIREDFA
jgi:hypothetical protein